MGLREVFKSAAQTIFVALGNVPISVTYTSVSGNPAYNPAVPGTITPTSTSYTVDMVPEDYTEEQIDGRFVLRADQKALIPVENLGCVPGPNDYITISGVRWNVVEKATDPAYALWSIQIRKA